MAKDFSNLAELIAILGPDVQRSGTRAEWPCGCSAIHATYERSQFWVVVYACPMHKALAPQRLPGSSIREEVVLFSLSTAGMLLLNVLLENYRSSGIRTMSITSAAEHIRTQFPRDSDAQLEFRAEAAFRELESRDLARTRAGQLEMLDLFWDPEKNDYRRRDS